MNPSRKARLRPASSRSGSALLVTLMLLVVLTAIGIFAISLTTKEMNIATQVKVGTILRNTAESGAYFGIGQLPTLYSGYSNHLDVAGGIQCDYTVTSVMSGNLSIEPGYGANFRFSNFSVTSRASWPSGTFVGSTRVDAEVRFGPVPAGTGY